MNKIATHDSVTSEESWWLTKPLTIFAKTQDKTISEQLAYGCRFFDIRVRKTHRGWICAHGLWETKKTADEILSEINKYETYCNITYEGFGCDSFVDQVNEWEKKYPNIKFVYVSIKYSKWFKWEILEQRHTVDGGAVDCFFKLDWSSWHTLLPIPKLWKKIYGPHPIFNEYFFQFVDFL